MSSKEIAQKLGAILSSGRDPAAKLDDVKRLADELETPRPSNFKFEHATIPWTSEPKLEGADVLPEPRQWPAAVQSVAKEPIAKSKSKSNARVKPATTKYRRSLHNG
jgi:hypothetical protein